MRRLLLILFTFSFSLFTSLCEAQFNTYHPFPDSNAAWRETSVVCDFCDGGGPGFSYPQFDYYVNGDTLVHGEKYIKVRASGGYIIYSNFPDTNWTCYNYLYCLLHEDTLAEKVYASFSPYTNDTLLYDFSLHVGDTLPVTYNNGASSNFYVYSIDSILVGSNYRKQFIIATDTGHLTEKFDSIVEGIGSVEGLFERISTPFEGGIRLDCFTDSTVSFVCTQYSFFFTNCNIFYTCIPTGILPIIDPKSNITAYPNPSNSIFTLESSSVIDQSSVDVYNELGKIVYSNSIIHSSSFKIDLSDQSSGVYLYRVLSDNGELIGEGKLVIQK